MVPHSVGGRRAHPSLSFPRAHSCAPRPRSSCLGGSARGGPPLCPASEPALERAPHTPKPPAVDPGRHAGEPGWGPAGLGRGLVETAGGGGCQSPCPSPTLGSWPIGQSLAPGWGGSVGSRAEAGHGWSPLDKGGRIFLPDRSPLRGVQGKALAVLPVAPAPEPGQLCQESPVCQQGVQVETGTGLGTLLMHTSCRGREGTWGARECSQPGPQGERGCLGRSWLLQVTAPHSLSGRCWARALMLSSLARAPGLTLCFLGAKGTALGARGSSREQQLLCPLGLGTRPPSVAAGKAEPGRA